MSNYEAVIFDQDGVLLDSGLNNFLWVDQTRKNAAEKKGYNFTTQDSLKIVHSTSQKEINNFLDEKEMTWSELQYIERKVAEKKVEMVKQGYIRLFPDTHRFLTSLNVPTGLATNASSISTDFVLDFFGLRHYFNSIHNIELERDKWFKRKKPNAVLLQEVMQDIGAENVLMVGDTSSDVGAAQAAEADSVLVESYKKSPELNPTYRVKNISEVSRLL